VTAVGNGDCFKVAAHLAMLVGGTGCPTWLCHGSALGTGGEAAGIRYDHAWVEVEDEAGMPVVLDFSNGNRAVVRLGTYYAAGTIRHVRRYPASEIPRHLREWDHYGPWDERFARRDPTPS
jgi:hypothetical protein